MKKQSHLQQLAILVGSVQLAAACSERIVDMDGRMPVVNSQATHGVGDDSVVVLNERVIELQARGKRVFWLSQTPDYPCLDNQMTALRSCVFDDCARTLVTYATSLASCSTPVDIQDTAPSATAPAGIIAGNLGTFATDDSRIYWGNRLFACPIEGCAPEASGVSIEDRTSEHVMADKLYWLNASNPFGLLRCVPERCTESLETIAVFDEPVATRVQGLTLDTSHAYWIADATIRRVALDGQSPIETFTASPPHPVALTIAGSDLYWANQSFPGMITRCPIAGCEDNAPMVVVDRQIYPNWTGVIGASLIWTNTNGFGDEVELRHCRLTDCSGSSETLESTASRVRGHWVEGDTLYYGTATSESTTTAIHRRRF